MNAERLHAIALAIQSDLQKTGVLQKLTQLLNALRSQVQQPNQPQHQQQVSQAHTDILNSLKNSSADEFSPTWQQVVHEIGLENFLGSRLSTQIDSIFKENQITPASALQQLEHLKEQVTNASNAIDAAVQGLNGLSIGSEKLRPGECEVGVLIPRLLVENRLDKFSDELKQLTQIFQCFAEVTGSHVSDFKVRTISSSDLSVFLEAGPKICAFIASAIDCIVKAYKGLLEIRKSRAELKKAGVPEETLAPLDEHASKVMNLEIDKFVENVQRQFLKSDDVRTNELTVQLKYSMKKIANRIDRGLSIEVRMIEGGDHDDDKLKADNENYYSAIQDAKPSMQFIKAEGDPILALPESPDVAGGPNNS